MARLTIQLRRNPQTGALDVRVALRSEEDSLPLEHELRHRELVEDLIARLPMDTERRGNVRVRRERPVVEPALG